MLEDEIQYLGTKSPTGHPFTPSSMVKGVVLHVEANGDQLPFEMRFLRSLTSAVTIGRKSTSDHKLAPGEPSIAGFACQVVSGRHAKLAFSDNGFVYIVDLGSRHGTHIRRPGETLSKMLEPETVTMLNSGDYITFGKTVGKGSQLVPPITARVQFLYEREIYEVPSKTPSPVPIASPEPSRARKTSGRYGLYAPSSLSSPEHSSDDDSSSSKYDHDSDIEEISAHEANHNAMSSALPALRALQAQLHATSYDHGAPLRSITDNLAFIVSRSHSPMDLSSPTPSPVGAYPLDLEFDFSAGHDRESSISRSSEASSDDEAEKEAGEAEKEDGEAEQEAGETNDVGSEPVPESAGPLFSDAVTPSPLSRGASVNLDADLGRPLPADVVPAAESRSPSPPSEFDFQGQVKVKEHVPEGEKQVESIQTIDMPAQINESIERIGRELREAATAEELWNATNAASLNAALGGLPGPTDVREWATFVLNKAVAAAPSNMEVDKLPSTGPHDGAGPSISPVALHSPLRDETAETLTEVKASVAAMTALVSELKSLHENMERQMTEKLTSIEIARAELIAATAEAEARTTLKRKRTESELTECAWVDVEGITAEPLLALEARPTKRLRRIASSVMHTATAATVGAVATWAALAFS